MEYSAFNYTVWGLFAGFILLTWAAVRLFHKRNPGYPGDIPDTLA